MSDSLWWVQVRPILMGLATVFILAIPCVYMWNWVGPSVFGGPELGYWQVLVIGILSRYLLGNLTCGITNTTVNMNVRE